MAEAILPEEMIVLILTWLPVKSLIRFTCVSRRFHSLILSDPKFAQSQFQAARDRKTLTRRILRSTDANELDSVDLESPSFGSSVNLPFQPAAGDDVIPLGSCNGIVFLTINDSAYYMWNPSTGFFKILPHPCLPPSGRVLIAYGVGCLAATEDYRVFIVSMRFGDNKIEVDVFSFRAHAWKTLDVDFDGQILASVQGILSKEALHWLDNKKEIVAFDLGQEEKHKFRRMLLPRDGGDIYENLVGVSAGGCLCLAHYQQAACIDIWIMREYDVHESWTKLCNLKFLDSPNKVRWYHWYAHILIMETRMGAEIFVGDAGKGLVKIMQEEEDNCSIYMIEGDWYDMIPYEESLLWIED